MCHVPRHWQNKQKSLASLSDLVTGRPAIRSTVTQIGDPANLESSQRLTLLTGRQLVQTRLGVMQLNHLRNVSTNQL